MKRINELVAVFQPPGVHLGMELYRRNKFFIYTCFITALFALGYMLMSIYIHGEPFAQAMLVSFIAFCILPVLLKKGLPLWLLIEAFIANIAIVVILLIYWEGGIRTANTAPWTLVLPIFAMLTRGPKSAWRWLVVAIVIILAFSYFTFQGVKFPVRFDISKAPLFNTLSLAGLVCIVTTIFYVSEREKRLAQRDLKNQNAELENLNNEKDTFLSIVSHDLKNPLLIITEYAKYLSESGLSEEEKVEYLGHITSSGSRMLELIKNLLDIKIIESGKMVINKTVFSVNDMIKTYMVEIGPIARAKHIRLTSLLPEDCIELETDQARLRQVLDNYVSNAMKYCPDETSVSIELRETADFIELSVKDAGPGIDDKELEKLFLPFSTTSSEPRQGEGSSGLGLAVVKKIGDSINAAVGCISVKGEGCTFYIRFPK